MVASTFLGHIFIPHLGTEVNVADMNEMCYNLISRAGGACYSAESRLCLLQYVSVSLSLLLKFEIFGLC